MRSCGLRPSHAFFLISTVYLGMLSTACSGRESVLEQAGTHRTTVPDGGKTVSGKAGSMFIAYTGDILGSLDPCG